MDDITSFPGEPDDREAVATEYRAAAKVSINPDDALLASAMRKLLNTEGYANWYAHPASGECRLTVDTGHAVITAEEMAAIERAVQE